MTRFKSKYVIDSKYYAIRKWGIILPVITGILISMLLNATPWFWWIIVCTIFITMIGGYYLGGIMRKRYPRQALLASADEIKVIDESGTVKQSFDLEQVDKVEVSEGFDLAQNNFRELFADIFGSPRRDHITIHQGTETQQLFFEVDSEYAKNQLTQVIDIWKEKGLVQ